MHNFMCLVCIRHSSCHVDKRPASCSRYYMFKVRIEGSPQGYLGNFDISGMYSTAANVGGWRLKIRGIFRQSCSFRNTNDRIGHLAVLDKAWYSGTR
jgi:hypothetical protein